MRIITVIVAGGLGFALVAVLLAARPVAQQRRAAPDDADSIRAQLAALPQTGGNAQATGRCGGIVTILPGDITITRPIVVPDGAIIRGQGGNTRIINRGTGPAFVFHSPYGHGQTVGSTIEDLMIYSDTGGGIACDESVVALEGARIRNVTINTQGPAVDLRPKSRCYFVELETVVVPGSGTYAIRIDGFSTSLRNVRVNGNPRPGFVTPEAMVILTGNATIEGNAGRYEGSWPCPYIAVRAYKQDDGSLWPSTLTWLGGYVEAHGQKFVGDLQDCSVWGFYLPWAMPESPWRVREKVEFRLLVPPLESGIQKAP